MVSAYSFVLAWIIRIILLKRISSDLKMWWHDKIYLDKTFDKKKLYFGVLAGGHFFKKMTFLLRDLIWNIGLAPENSFLFPFQKVLTFLPLFLVSRYYCVFEIEKLNKKNYILKIYRKLSIKSFKKSYFNIFFYFIII